MTDTLTTLVKQLQKGDEMAAHQLYHHYAKGIYSLLIRFVANREDAQDLLQEVFVRAFMQVNQLKEPKAFGGWVKQMTINQALQHLRKKQIVFVSETIPEPQNHSGNDPLAHMEPEHIHQAVQSLPMGCRTVLNLYLLEGYKHAEIAELLGISVSTSKSQYHYARQLLREKLLKRLCDKPS